MSEISINTTQNVNIFFNVASIGARLGAYLIDLVMKIFYIIFIQWAFISNMGLGNLNLDTWSEMSIYIIFYLPVTFYSIVQESLMEGQTIGKKVCSIKVVKIDGYQASFTDYLTRWVFRLVDVTGSLCVAGAISMIASPRHQRLGDIAAGTAVISLKNDINISHTILENISTDYQPTYSQVIRFSDNDMRIIKETFLTARKNNDYETLRKLVKKIEEICEIKSSGSETNFIQTVIKDYNFYTGE
ncbi:MAG: RDD family protein [Saprospiraceae bacterium]|nr:RDD family protein [Saprospiraceae bacterium]MBK8669204.1 RDD family protein [Saprospiraceae bacterium]